MIRHARIWLINQSCCSRSPPSPIPQNKWTLWYDNPQRKATQQSWSRFLKKVTEFDHVEDFWAYVAVVCLSRVSILLGTSHILVVTNAACSAQTFAIGACPCLVVSRMKGCLESGFVSLRAGGSRCAAA